ncbi:arylesterase [soil metagenome]
MRILPVIYVLLCFSFLASCGEKTTSSRDSGKQETVETTVENVTADTGVVLFFGTSLTAGLGLEQEQAYPALIQKKIDSLDLPYQVVNAGLSGETTAGGRSRIDWVLNQNVDVFVLELGANDGLRGVPIAETRRNLQAIIDAVKENNPDVRIVLTGMQIPPNMGREYATGFRNIFPELAEENEIFLIPFLLENVGGIRELNQRDGIHPTAEGQKIMANTVWKVLEPELRD